MHWIRAIPLILILSSTTAITPASTTGHTGLWRAYVCRVTDWVDCEQGRNNRRIYPVETLYPDQDICLKSFGSLFENDPAISGTYPQTNDPGSSYVYDCEIVKQADGL